MRMAFQNFFISLSLSETSSQFYFLDIRMNIAEAEESLRFSRFLFEPIFVSPPLNSFQNENNSTKLIGSRLDCLNPFPI